MISMQKDLSTVSFVYLAVSALSPDFVYLINVYKAKRNKILEPWSENTILHVIRQHENAIYILLATRKGNAYI